MDCFSQEEKLKLEELSGFVETKNFPKQGNYMKARDRNNRCLSNSKAIFK